MRKIMVNVGLEAEQILGLKKIAREEGISVSHVIRQAIDDYLENSELNTDELIDYVDIDAEMNQEDS